MKTLLAAILILAIAIALMCVGIIVKGKFPETEVSKNENMRRLGVKCMHEQEKELFGTERQRQRSKSCTGTYSDQCAGCGFYNK
ncbi:MAG: hypothetical protein II632_03975 [Bacteroidales bacterium]|nr:hypothetical protein [Bacteroidales bacterium]MBQ3977984.1 hypothetical protein [Bacteroidales bacterium]MBQ5979928.1 hypothetical protein [Bacteroidales bacterium]MBQ6184274.1 hypothetical protein [Bacteroidales bacterium]